MHVAKVKPLFSYHSLNADSSLMLNGCDNVVCGKECTVTGNQYFHSVLTKLLSSGHIINCG